MAPITLLTQTANDIDYISQINTNWATIEGAINTLDAQILAAVGDGALLILDAFDRDGLVGAQSYQLDILNYAGGAQIDIGRRPVFNPALGEVDESIAWVTVGGNRTRVQQATDVTLDATSIVVTMPTTIFVGVGSSGTAQLFPDQTAANVLYIYSMTWNAFSLTNFRRLAPILPGYPTLQEIVKAPRIVQLFDSDTDWLVDLIGRTEIVLPGEADDNAIGLEASMQVLGGFVSFHRGDFDGCHAPTGAAPDNELELRLTSAAVKWNLEQILIDCSNIPDTIFFRIDTAVVGDLRFVNEARRFQLEKISVGSSVVSARGMTWGLYVKPMIGLAIPKDESVVDDI